VKHHVDVTHKNIGAHNLLMRRDPAAHFRDIGSAWALTFTKTYTSSSQPSLARSRRAASRRMYPADRSRWIRLQQGA
jgi:hypothetical protein